MNIVSKSKEVFSHIILCNYEDNVLSKNTEDLAECTKADARSEHITEPASLKTGNGHISKDKEIPWLKGPI